MATGVGFGFDTSFLKNLELADKRMGELMKKSDSLAFSVTSAFQKMSSGGVLPFVKELETRLHALQNVEFTIGDSADKDLKKLKESTASAIESINTLLGTLYKSQGYKIELEQVLDKEKYERWLMQKHNEAKEHKRIEDEKTQATAEAIRKQNEAFAEQARKEAEIKQQNATAASNSEKARQSYIETVKMYDQMFDEIDKKEQQYAAERDKRNEQEKKSKLKQLDEQIRAYQEYQERQRKIEDLAKAREKAYKERAGSNRSQNEAYNTSYEGAIDFSGRANSINREKKAIEYLTAARNSLSKSDADYTNKLNKLNEMILTHEENIRRAESASKQLKEKHSNLMNTADQLQRKLALLFSVSAITGYVKRVVDVTAEFQLQQRSLALLINDTTKAKELWAEIKTLAVQSPFQIKELVTYTKQLAAYRIESENLFDTTKRLADISAGLGVDMQRLILAYGQVRSAEFLRGTELRQFTEAGLPMLDALAKRFSNLEGAAISAADVFERISSRRVLFSDVEAVIKGMTDVGGVFYKMQEEQAETLAGQISNLKDRISIMLNEIGTDYEGTIRRFMKFTTSLLENWQAVAQSFKGLALLFGYIKLQALLSSEAMIEYAFRLGIVNSVSTKSLTVSQLLQVAYQRLTKAIVGASKAAMSFAKSNWWLLALTAIAATAWEVYQHFNRLDEKVTDIEKRFQEVRDSISVMYADLAKAGDIGGQRSALQQLVDMAEKDFGIDIRFKVSELDSAQVIAKFKELRSQIEMLTDFSEHFSKTFERVDASGDFGVLDDLFEDMEELQKNASSMSDFFQRDAAKQYDKYSKIYYKLTDTQKKALEDFKNYTRSESESEFQYIARMIIAYKTMGLQVTNSLTSDMENAKDEILDAFDKLNIDLNDPNKAIKIKVGIDQLAIEKEWNDFVRKFAYWVANERFNIKLSLSDEDTPEKQFSSWQKEFNEKFADAGFPSAPTGPLAVTNSNTSTTQHLSTLTERYKELTQAKEQYNLATNEEVKLSVLRRFGTQDLQGIDAALKRTEEAIRFLGGKVPTSNNRGSRRKGRNDIVGQYRDMLEIITTLNEDFKKFNEYLGANAAKQQVVAIYADKVKEIYKKLGWTIDDINFTTVDGTVKAMEELLKKAKEVKGLDSFVGDLTIKIAKFKADAGQEDLAKAFEKVQEQVEGLFDDYEIYMELEEMGVPKDFAASLFGLDALSLEDVKKKLQALKDAGKFDGKKEEEAYEEYLRKIEKMEQEHLERLLKDYVKYSLETVSERAKIQLKYYRDIERINAATKNNPQARAAIMEGLSKEYKADMQKNEWEEFQETDFFIRLFGDLQNASKSAIEKMISDLEKYKKTWTNLPIDQIEELAKKLEELREAQAQLEAQESPWGAYREARKAIRKDGRTRKEAETDMAKSEKTILGYEQQISSLEAIRSLLLEGKDAQAQINEFNEKYGTNIKANVDSVELLVAGLKSGVANERSIVEAVIKLLRYYRQADNALEEQINALGKIKQITSDLHGAFSELHEALGGDSESPAAIFAEMGTNITTGILSIGEMVVSFKKAQEGAKGLEKAMNTAMGVVGWIVQGVQIISSIFTAIATNKDNKIKKKIEETKEEVEKLQKEFEKLEEAIEKAFTANDLQRQFIDGIANINEQIQKQEELIALEESRKKSKRDENAIKEAKEEIEELKKQRQELLQSTVEDLGGTYDIRGAAREFVDAWVDAFRETGNGLKGLEDNFKEFFENILFEQAVMTGAGAIMKPLLDDITAALEDDYLLDETETKGIQKMAKDQLGKLNTFMESFYSMYPEIFDAASELSGLSAGIEGITENQADVISSYLNTIRFFVASIDAKTSELIALQGGATQQNDANPMLAQLQIVAQQTTAINELLSSVRKTGHSHGGYGIKVFVD